MSGRLLANGRIWTGDGRLPWAECAVIRDGRFEFVGREQDIDATGMERIELSGNLVVPGWWDAHVHLMYTGMTMRQVQLKGVTSIAEAQRRVAAMMAQSPPDAWIEGAGWDQNDWGGSFPDKADLDAVAPWTPVVLMHTSGHCAWVNSAALRAARIEGSTPVPEGGSMPLGDDGEPSGIFFDRAVELVTSKAPARTQDERLEAVRLAVRNAHALGIVGVHAMDVGSGELAAIEALHASGELSLRVRYFLGARDESVWEGRCTGQGDEVVRVGGVKFFADGALGSLTAAMFEPYEGTDDRGLPLQPVEQLEEAVRRALELGLAPAIHAIGDRANHETLGILERTRAVSPGLPRRIEHAQLLGPGMIERFRELGMTASVQPIHATQDMAKVDRYWGERGGRAYVFRSLLDGGVNLAFGSDTPVETMDPLAGVHAAVSRQRADGMPAAGWYPNERLGIDAALAAYSAGVAVASGEQGKAGRIAEGCFADCVVLSRDIVSEPGSVLDTSVEMTIVAGSVVYRRDQRGVDHAAVAAGGNA